MSEWSPQDWAVFLGVLTPFVAALVAGVIAIIRALKENTGAIVEGNIDRRAQTEILRPVELTAEVASDMREGGAVPVVNVAPDSAPTDKG